MVNVLHKIDNILKKIYEKYEPVAKYRYDNNRFRIYAGQTSMICRTIRREIKHHEVSKSNA